MRALEFRTRIKNNHIQIPAGIMSELIRNQDNDIRVIVLIDDDDLKDYSTFQQSATNQFLDGYAAEDDIYDKY